MQGHEWYWQPIHLKSLPGGGGKYYGKNYNKKKKELEGDDDDAGRGRSTGGVKKGSSLIAAGYRDRALERRLEESKTQVGDGSNNFGDGKSLIHQQPDNDDLDQDLDNDDDGVEEMKPDVSIEQSKFLGGDEEHTHLVKGLDYALLAKMRQQVEKEQIGKKKKSNVKSMNIFGDDSDDSDNDMQDNDAQEEDDDDEPHTIETSTVLGASLKKLVCNEYDMYSFNNFSIDRDELLSEMKGNISSSIAADPALTKLQKLQETYKEGQVISASVQSGLDAKQRLFANEKSKAGDLLARITYQFETNATSEIDIPLTILKSKLVSFMFVC